MSARSGITFAVAAFAAVAMALPARAQSAGILEGVVRDQFGGIAHARVIAVDSLTREQRHAETNERGYFRMLGIGSGRWTVSSSVLGRTPAARIVRLLEGERIEVELVLERAPEQLQPMVVHDRRAPIESIARMSVGTALTSAEIDRLPLDSRNVMDLAATAAGIRSVKPVSGHSLPAAGSLRDERGINLYVDGVEMKNLNSGNVVGSPQSGSLVPVDALEEFRVLLQPYDAEYARGAAYIVSVATRRGTNETHGSVFGHFQGRDLLSVTDFQRGIPNFEKPDFARRQGGMSVRGPVVRDRLFYALSYELSQSDSYVSVVPGRPASNPGIWDRYAGVFDAPDRNHAAALHLTWTASEAQQLDGLVIARRFSGESRFGGIETRQSAVTTRSTVTVGSLRHRWLLAPGLVNEASLQLVTWDNEGAPVIRGPTLSYPTLLIGHADARFGIHERQLRATERVMYGIGSGPRSHLLKAGMEIAKVSADQFSPNNGDGLFRFKSETGDPADAMIAVGFTDATSDRDAETALTGWVAGIYLNDEWHPTDRLVLNLGVRYDAELHTMDNDFTAPWLADPVLSSRPELEGLLNHGDRRDDLNNVSPRLSFSWDASGSRRAFVRGGFGIMYDRVPGFVPFQERRSATWRNYTFLNPGTLDPAVLRARVIAGGGNANPALTLLPHRMDVPENRQWSLGVGVRLAPAVTVNVDYVDQDVRHLFAPVNLNALDLSQTPVRRAISTSYGNIVAWGDFARARYRALLTSITLGGDSAFMTLAHTLASARADWDVENTAVPAAVAARYYTLQRTSGDERHRFVISGAWQMPFGLAASGIITVASPRPYRTTLGQDLNQDQLQDDDWIGSTRYGVPPNAWRNWYRTVDVRIVKPIGLGGHARLLLVAEAFNLFNTENYTGYSGVLRTSTGELRPDFGAPSGVFATRQLQIGSRLQF